MISGIMDHWIQSTRSSRFLLEIISGFYTILTLQYPSVITQGREIHELAMEV